MELIYENEMGSLKLSGGGGDGFCICEIDGFDLPERERSLKSYIGEDGEHEESSRYSMRVISVAGDLRCSEGHREIMRKASRILSYGGLLTVDSGDSVRVITVNSASISFGKSYNYYRTFVIQMSCDYPHFKDAFESEKTVFKKINYLSSDAVLPTMLSERISEGTVSNNGDLKLYPIIKITKNSDTVSENIISVANLTTGKSIELNKKMAVNEEIVINVYDRTITSSVEGNIMGTLAMYSSLADLWLGCGENIISVSVNGTQRGIVAEVFWTNEYTQMI